MSVLGKKTHATKYVNKPSEYPDHAYYAPEKLITTLKKQGVSDIDLKDKLIQYIDGERKKCIADIRYFAQTYGFITGETGIIPFELEKYQEDLLHNFQNEKYIIVVKGRQLGVSTALMFYALWFSIFSTGKRCLVVAHRKESAEEFVTKLKTAYEFLPEWLKPACTLYSKNTVEFDTKSVVKAMTSNPHAARSFSATVFLIDEAAFIKDADDVAMAISPTVAASGGKLIAISTPNGNSDTNWFYRTFSTAKAGQNNWKWSELPWTVSKRFTKNPNFRQDQIRLDNGNVDKFKQEYECFPAGSGVLTPTGVRPIEEIKINDTIISHAGRVRKVHATNSKYYCGKLYSISSYGSSEPIICTPEHPIRVYDRTSQTYSWVEAKNISTKQLLVFPKNTLNTSTFISEPLCKLMAWYITEGSIGKGQIVFSLSKEDKEKQHVIDIISSLGYQYSEKLTTGWQITINDSKLTDYLSTNCGTLAENKCIPIPLISGYEQVFFDELILGDGCHSISSNTEKYSYRTISKSLAYQIQFLSHSLGQPAGISIIQPKPYNIDGRTGECSLTYQVQMTIQKEIAKSTKLIKAKNCIAAVIKSINTIDFDGIVYNFSVDYDESYIIAGRAVHNCEFNVNLTSLFNRDTLKSFVVSDRILNKGFGGVTYEDTFYIWKTADPTKRYIIGVDCASNKVTAKDSSCFQVIDDTSYEQHAEYVGKLPTEVFVDILMKAGRHYNNAMLVIEQNSYSEMVFYLLEQRGYNNIWYDPIKNTPGFQTNRATRSLLIEKLLLFYNNMKVSERLHSGRLKIQMENFSAGSIYADGSRKFEAIKGNDDAVMALALAVVSLTPKEHIHRPVVDFNIALDPKDMNDGEYSPEYIEFHSKRMGISAEMLSNRLKLYHKIKSGIYDGSGLEDLPLQHPVEEFERQLAEQDFIGSMTPIISDTYSNIETLSLIPKNRQYSIDDIFSEEFQTVSQMHRNFLFDKSSFLDIFRN